MADDGVVTEITGTYRNDMEVGKTFLNQMYESFGDKYRLTFKVLRESTEQEYRDKYNYRGPLPTDPFGRKPRFFEIVALD